MAAVRENSLANYMRVLHIFAAHCRTQAETWQDAESLDAAAVTFMQVMFQDGESASMGETLVAALRHVYAASTPLPRCVRALRGWRRLAPPNQRLPLKRAAGLAIAGWLIAHHQPLMAVAVCLALVCYLRPMELLTLQRQHLIPPCPAAGFSHWGLLLHETALGIPGKTGLWDSSVAVDLDPWLWEPLRALHSRRRDGQFLWDFTGAQLRMHFKTAVSALGLGGLSDHLYSLRHGGASYDLLMQRRTLLAIRERGRWMSDASLRRYAKATLLQRETNKVPVAVLEFGAAVEGHFCQFLLAAA